MVDHCYKMSAEMFREGNFCAEYCQSWHLRSWYLTGGLLVWGYMIDLSIKLNVIPVGNDHHIDRIDR